MDSKVLREITPLNENDFMYVADRHKKEFDYPIHIHDVLELNFVANAAGARRVVGDSSEVIDNLDLVLITSPDLEHVWEQYECKSEDIHEVTVQFRLNFDLDTSSFRFSSYKSIYDMLIRAQRGLAFPPEAIMLVYHRLAELSKFNDARELASSSFAKVEVVSESKRILKVKNYIDEHYKDDLSLEQLADLVGMTPTAFSRYFKQRTAKNISEYIVDIRLGHAARLLVDTSDSVSEICWATGFNTLSNFNRLFRKRKGCSPTEFREKYQKTKVIV